MVLNDAMWARHIANHGMGLLREATRGTLALWYPPICFLCEQTDATNMLCQECRGKLEALENTPACSRCAMAIKLPNAPCPFCRGKGPGIIHSMAALGRFSDPLRHLLHLFKYHQNWAVGHMLSERLLNQPRAIELLKEADVLVPVPLHPFRQFTRGFNQASVIAHRLAKATSLPVICAVERIRNTPTQTFLHSRHRREQNMSDAFALAQPRRIVGKRVLLIDDVVTVGATMRAVARCVREARPMSINALALAVADDKRRDLRTY